MSLEEAQLGLATTEELFRELIARFEVTSQTEEFDSSTNFLRAQTLWNILYGMDEKTKAYRTVDH